MLGIISEYWRVIVQYWILRKLNLTWNWRITQRNENCTERPGSMTFWRCGKSAKTYVLYRRNVAHKTTKRQRLDTFRIPTRSSRNPGPTSIMKLRLHLNCQNAHLCNHLCLQSASLGDEPKYKTSAKSEQLTIIQEQVLRLARPKAFPTSKIGSTRMEIWIIQMTVKMTVRQTMNPT